MGSILSINLRSTWKISYRYIWISLKFLRWLLIPWTFFTRNWYLSQRIYFFIIYKKLKKDLNEQMLMFNPQGHYLSYSYQHSNLHKSHENFLTNFLSNDFENLDSSNYLVHQLLYLIETKKWGNMRNELVNFIIKGKEYRNHVAKLLEWFKFSGAQWLTEVRRFILGTLSSLQKSNSDKFSGVMAVLWESIPVKELNLFLERYQLTKLIRASALATRGLTLASLRNPEVLIEKLLKDSDFSMAFLVALLEPQTKMFLVKALIKFFHVDIAAEYAKALRLNYSDFPEIVHLIQRQSSVTEWVNKGHTWWVLEEKMRDDPHLIDFWLKRHFKSTQLKPLSDSIAFRAGLQPQKPKTYYENPLFATDSFAPAEENLGFRPRNHFLNRHKLGYNGRCYFIETFDDDWELAVSEIERSKLLSFAGKQNLNLGQEKESELSILQIATKQDVFLFDFQTLQKEEKFRTFMKKIFQRKDITKVGIQTNSLLKLIVKEILEEEESCCFQNCPDISDQLKKVRYDYSLDEACLDIFGKTIPTFENSLNWKARPLRKAQLYQATLEAAILYVVYSKLESRYSKEELNSTLSSQLVEKEKDSTCDLSGEESGEASTEESDSGNPKSENNLTEETSGSDPFDYGIYLKMQQVEPVKEDDYFFPPIEYLDVFSSRLFLV